MDFYANGVLLGSDPSALYTYTWTGAPVGAHVLTARTFNALNVTGLSVPVPVTVEPPPLLISVSPASPTATNPAVVTIGGPAGCTTVRVDFGDGTSDTFLNGAGLPVAGAHVWGAPGTKTITATGQGGDCPSRSRSCPRRR